MSQGNWAIDPQQSKKSITAREVTVIGKIHGHKLAAVSSPANRFIFFLRKAPGILLDISSPCKYSRFLGIQNSRFMQRNNCSIVLRSRHQIFFCLEKNADYWLSSQKIVSILYIRSWGWGGGREDSDGYDKFYCIFVCVCAHAHLCNAVLRFKL